MVIMKKLLKIKIKYIQKKEEENLYKEHKIETKKIEEKRNIKEITKKGYNKYEFNIGQNLIY